MIVYEVGPVLLDKSSYQDIAVVLGVLHGYNDDGMFGHTDDQVLITAHHLAMSFLTLYPIANVTTDTSGGTLGIPIG